MALDAMRIRWQDRNATRHGTRGQRQDGVDIYGTKDGALVGAQAKNVEKLPAKAICDEIAKAELFQPAIAEYYLVIGGDRDGPTQKLLREVSANRIAEGQFPVYPIFFDEVASELATSPDLVAKYWKHFFADFAQALATKRGAPILDADSAFDLIESTDEYQTLLEFFKSVNNPRVRLSMVIEHTPDLNAPAGDMARYWQIAIGESWPERTRFLERIALAVEGGDARIWSHDARNWIALSNVSGRNEPNNQ